MSEQPDGCTPGGGRLTARGRRPRRASSTSQRSHQLGSVPAKSFVSDRTVEAAVSISNTLGAGPWDFDVRDVRLTVTYRVPK